MIFEKNVKKYCKDDITKIENYDKAMADSTQNWECHHRDEIRILPSGMVAIRSKAELIENGRYYDCPANELIFLTKSEHSRIHKKGANNPMYGKHHDVETKRKISSAKKGVNHPNYGNHLNAETRAKISAAKKGKPKSAEHKAKLEEARRKYWEKKRLAK